MNEELWAEQIKDLENKLAKAVEIANKYLDYSDKITRQIMIEFRLKRDEIDTSLTLFKMIGDDKESLEKLSEQSLEEKLKDCGVDII